MVRYHYREGVTLQKKGKSRWFAVFLGIVVLAAGLYILSIYIAPQLITVPFTRLSAEATDTKIKQSKAGEFGDRLFIPQVNVDVPVRIGGDKQQLSDGVWQRNTSLGDPEKGGNVVLSGLKFTWDPMPHVARAKSPFYNLVKLKTGDDLTLDYQGKRYVFKIDKVSESTARTSVEQKAGDDEFRLTLYAADSNGDAVSGPVVSAVRVSPALEATTNFGGND